MHAHTISLSVSLRKYYLFLLSIKLNPRAKCMEVILIDYSLLFINQPFNRLIQKCINK